RARAAKRGLLLSGRHRRELPPRAARLRDQPRGLQRDVAAQAIVERAGGQPPVGELDRLRVDHRDIAHAHAPARVLRVAGADVDVQLAYLLALLAVVLAPQVV